MRVLKFKVNDLSIQQDPECDFSGLVPGTEGYLWAEFSFSPEWDECVKVASFTSVFGKEYTPQVLIENRCSIPAEALVRESFKLRVMGKSPSKKLVTNKITVKQDGGKT